MNQTLHDWLLCTWLFAPVDSIGMVFLVWMLAVFAVQSEGLDVEAWSLAVPELSDVLRATGHEAEGVALTPVELTRHRSWHTVRFVLLVLVQQVPTKTHVLKKSTFPSTSRLFWAQKTHLVVNSDTVPSELRTSPADVSSRLQRSQSRLFLGLKTIDWKNWKTKFTWNFVWLNLKKFLDTFTEFVLMHGFRNRN